MLRLQSPILSGDRGIINSTKLASLHHTPPPPPLLSPSAAASASLARLESADLLPVAPAPLHTGPGTPFVCLCGYCARGLSNTSKDEAPPALAVYEVCVGKRNKKKGDDMLGYGLGVPAKRMTFAELVCSVQDHHNDRRRFVGWLPLAVAADCNARTLWTMTCMRFADFSELSDVKWATVVLLAGLTDALVHKLLERPSPDAARAFIALSRRLYQTYEQDQHVIDLCKDSVAAFECAESTGTAAHTGLNLGLYVVCRSVTDCEWARIAEFVATQTFRLLLKTNAKKVLFSKQVLSSKQVLESVFTSFRDEMKFVQCLHHPLCLCCFSSAFHRFNSLLALRAVLFEKKHRIKTFDREYGCGNADTTIAHKILLWVGRVQSLDSWEFVFSLS